MLNMKRQRPSYPIHIPQKTASWIPMAFPT